MNPYHRAFLASKRPAAAVRNDNLKIMRWLCVAYCPSILPMEGTIEAATQNNLHFLQWLFANTILRPWIQMVAHIAV